MSKENRYGGIVDVEPSGETFFKLGKCEMLLQTIRQLPLLPVERKDLYKASAVSAVRSMLAIDGIKVSADMVERIWEHIPPIDPNAEGFSQVCAALRSLSLLNEVVPRSAAVLELPILRGMNKSLGADGSFRDFETGRLSDGLPVGKQSQFETLMKTFFRAHVPGTLFAALATHAFLCLISPFKSISGRTAQLAEFYMAAAAGMPGICLHVLPSYYLKTKAQYDREVRHARTSLSLASFIDYSAEGLLSGLWAQYDAVCKALLEKTWQRHAHETLRQAHLSKRTFERLDDFLTILRVGQEYNLGDTIFAIVYGRGLEGPFESKRTIYRDLSTLISLGLLKRSSRGAYEPNVDELIQS